MSGIRRLRPDPINQRAQAFLVERSMPYVAREADLQTKYMTNQSYPHFSGKTKYEL